MSSFIASCSASLSRLLAISNKELIQMRRDRMTFAMMIGVPLMQLMLFGYAINTDPKQLPTAVVAHEQSPLVRTILQGLQNSGYYKLEHNVADYAQADALLAKGEVSFVITIPSGFTRKLIKGERPQLLIEADASDPAASSNAISRAQTIIDSALRHELKGSLSELNAGLSPVDLVIQRRYNPQGLTQYNIVPGLLGVIITMTMVMITGMAMTREVEQGTIENLLAMPAKPLEVMIGKIMPYVGVGAVQTLIILLAARYLFDVPFTGSLWLLLAAVALFIIANLALGFTFSTLAKSQMQAMQLTFFFFLPSLLLSGFMFPFRGMPQWAQWIGEVLPLTHFLRIVRGVMLKTADFNSIKYELAAILAFTLVVGVIAMARYKRTLD
ncbi:ABC transporter permease [Flavobacterium sp. W21_SRS_FM6]|uniref:ABC transporter permease n=1 Tax=Flavobacterium sp. W21_SRS_FM6 TaxID=3240268 RepID=UPI003F8DA54B